MTLRHSFFATALSIATLLTLSSAARADATVLGFTDDLGHVDQAAPVVAGTSSVARIPIYWTGVRTNGWGAVDPAVDAARASGQQVLFTITGVEAPNLDEWSAFLRELHARYPDLWGVQAWNEPNLANIGGLLSVGQTATIVQTAQAALPGVRVIGPSVSPTVPGAAAYQTELYGLLPDDIGVGVNIFTYRGKSGIADVVEQYRQAKADGGAAEVYVTEIGFHGAYFADQALNSGQAYGALRAEGAAAVIFYRLLTDPKLTVNWELTGRFAILNDDLSPTPILAALQNSLTDITPPKVKKAKADVNPAKKKVKISFKVAPSSTVNCTLDKQKPKPCSSPVTYKKLKYGKHKVLIAAMDPAGNQTTQTEKFKLQRP